MSKTKLNMAGFDEVYRLECGGTVAFVALHAILHGRTFGGIRIRRYPNEEAALADALDLARAMSRKVVMAGIEGGGAKAVIMEPDPARRADAVRDLGKFIESMRGRYSCAADLGFTPEDEAVLKAATRYAAREDLTPHTVRSVLIAMRTVIEPQSIAIQGLGAIGRPLAEDLRMAGVRVVASDVRPVKGFDSVPPEAIYEIPCDVFAPCAIGGVLNMVTIPRLRCRVVCGAANNPLATDDDADRLHKRGIVYVPDFISNCGATAYGASAAAGEPHLVEERMNRIGPLTREIVDRARKEDRSPHRVAIAMADERIATARRSRR